MKYTAPMVTDFGNAVDVIRGCGGWGCEGWQLDNSSYCKQTVTYSDGHTETHCVDCNPYGETGDC